MAGVLRRAFLGAAAFALAALSLPDALPFAVDLADRLEQRAFETGLPSAQELGDLARRCQVTRAFGPEVVLCPQALPLEAFSPHLTSALVAAEDRRFLAHGGVDKAGILRAMAGQLGLLPESGGSTVTQQLARTLFLDPADDVVMRKAREWVIARRLESVLDKPTLIAAYLNVAPHAASLFGFESAARHFFGKHAADLDIMESAMLVAMLPEPNGFDLRQSRDKLIAATTRVIRLMRDQEFITATQTSDAIAAAKQRIGKARLFAGDPAMRASARRPFEYRRVRDLAIEQAARRGVENPARLFLTLDPDFQAMADRIAGDAPSGYSASVLLTDPRSDVLAIAGPDYGSVQYNAAFQGERSLGSLGKTLVLAAALESPGLADRSFSTAPLDGYSPREDSRWCRGKMKIPEALAHSCNRPFVRLAALTRAGTARLTRDFGFAVPDNILLTPTGGVYGNPYSVARMFAAFANGGWLKELNAFAGALDADGRLIAAAAPALPRRVISAEAAGQLALDLRRPVTATHGTARAAAGKHQAAHVSGKTGTSNDGRDAWFAGFTADFTGVIAAQATGKKGTQSGGGYPAASFGGIVDSYWTEKNWRLANDSERALGPVWRWTEARLHTLVPEAGRLIAMILLAALLLKSRRRLRKTVPALPGAEPLPEPAPQAAPVAVPAAAVSDRPLAGSDRGGAAARATARPLAGSAAFKAYFGVAPADALRSGADE